LKLAHDRIVSWTGLTANPMGPQLCSKSTIVEELCVLNLEHDMTVDRSWKAGRGSR